MRAVGKQIVRHRMLLGILFFLALNHLIDWGPFNVLVTFAQTTQVTGQVKDVNGIPYAGAQMRAGLVFNGTPVSNPTVTISVLSQCRANGFGSAPCQVPFTPSNGPFNLDSAGNIPAGGITLQDNSLVTPAGTQWAFSVSTPGNPPPLGTGPQTCSATVTISGSSVSVSSNFSTCPALSNVGAGSAYYATAQNVVTNGAIGDAQESSNFTLNGTTQTCSDCGFVASRDVAKEIACGLNGTTQLARTTITSVVNATTITTAGSAPNTSAVCAWGTSSTVNDAAFAKAHTAVLAQLKARVSAGNLGGPFTGAPVFYVPTGAYLLCNFGISLGSASGGAAGAVITGDSREASRMIYESGCNASGANALLEIQGSVQNTRIENLLFDGMRGSQGGTIFNTAWLLSGTTFVNYVTIQRFGIGDAISADAAIFSHDGLFVAQNSGIGILCSSGCGGSIDNGGSSNNGGANLVVQNVVGENTGSGFRIGKGWLNDECGGSACAQIVNSQDVWCEGCSLFGNPTALSVDGTSFMHLVGGIVGIFGNDGNGFGLTIANGGQVQSSDVRYVSSGTAKCITNNGSFYDNGGNSCESQFPIASGTSTANTAVLTLTLAGANVNANCSVGDSLIVEGASPVGYNGYFPFGITAVTATTLTYTTVGSNLGAASAVGAAYCRNLQTYSGNLPKALLNNPVPNTCYVTGTFGVTVTGAPMCNFRAQSATNITRITAASTTSTTCATPPVVTISDGTVSWTLTLTSGKSQWDSAVDASTGVGTTIAKPNGTIQVTNTAGTCATPPTNFSVSYNIAPVLSN